MKAFIFFVVFGVFLSFFGCEGEEDSTTAEEVSTLIVTDLKGDEEPIKEKTWSWNCSALSCTYRYVVNTNKTHVFRSSDDYADVNTTAWFSGTGVFYLHVQAKSLEGDESLVTSVSTLIDNSPPALKVRGAVTIPSNSLYTHGNLDFILSFDENTFINLGTNPPRIPLTLGLKTVYAEYVNGSGSESLVFRYIIVGGDLAEDGLELGGGIELQGAVLKDSLGNETSTLSIGSLNLSRILVDAKQPSLNKVTSSPGINGVGAVIILTAVFDEVVMIERQGGVPQMQVSLSSGQTGLASYAGMGSPGKKQVFHYVVKQGNNDGNGIEIMGFHFNGGGISNSLGHKVMTTLSSPLIVTVIDSGQPVGADKLIIDTTAPEVTGLALNFDPTKSRTWTWGCSESPCTYRHVITQSDYPGAFRNGGDDSFFDDTLTVSKALGDGRYYVHVKARDTAGNVSSVATGSVFLDNTPPALINEAITFPADGLYRAVGDFLDFVVAFDEQVQVETAQGVPSLSLTMGVRELSASYHSSSLQGGQGHLTFRYTLVQGDEDLNGIALSNSIQLNSGVIKDLAGNTATLSTLVLPEQSSVRVDVRNPTLDLVEADEGSYSEADVIAFKAYFSENVMVVGSPKLTLSIGTDEVEADLTGNNRNMVNFKYTVLAGEEDDNGIEVKGINLGTGGRIHDHIDQDIALPLSVPLTVSQVFVDTSLPTIQSITVASGGYVTGDHIDIILVTNEAVEVDIAQGAMPIQIGLTFDTGGRKYANYLEGNGSTTLTFRYTVESGVRDSNGIGMDSTITFNGGSIFNAVLYTLAADLTLPLNLNEVRVP